MNENQMEDLHIQLRSTTQLGKPSPRKGAFAVGDAIRQFEIKRLGAIDTRATSLDALDDFEYRVFSRCSVRSHAQLAGATTMNCASFEANGLFRSYSHGVHCRDCESVLGLAGILVCRDGRAIHFVHTVGNRRLHDHVGIGAGQEGTKCNN